MNEEALRLNCLEKAMEIYRRNNVPHMEVSNVADALYRFVKFGESQASLWRDKND